MKRRLNLLREFSVPLLAGVVIAVVWANLDAAGYRSFNSTPFIGGLTFHFISNELFMVFFFGIAAVEIIERPLQIGRQLHIARTIKHIRIPNVGKNLLHPTGFSSARVNGIPFN